MVLSEYFLEKWMSVSSIKTSPSLDRGGIFTGRLGGIFQFLKSTVVEGFSSQFIIDPTKDRPWTSSDLEQMLRDPKAYYDNSNLRSARTDSSEYITFRRRFVSPTYRRNRLVLLDRIAGNRWNKRLKRYRTIHTVDPDDMSFYPSNHGKLNALWPHPKQ